MSGPREFRKTAALPGVIRTGLARQPAAGRAIWSRDTQRPPLTTWRIGIGVETARENPASGMSAMSRYQINRLSALADIPFASHAAGASRVRRQTPARCRLASASRRA
ncbi:hypothetical protein MACH15_21470 [Maricaulis maris]|jgi:hypothetical protein|nr:hypothetical protein MACH15_21470 [Maricaulis maris]